jgi:hypothetical protein
MHFASFTMPAQSWKSLEYRLTNARDRLQYLPRLFQRLAGETELAAGAICTKNGIFSQVQHRPRTQDRCHLPISLKID